ncbi:hypothetical protein [Pengzhenrongella phosphoraccumulans]|uniref:hypothetical protein n=1 Tax=Pengzhenrongella phosphoraccumulans TaxID=3114394 RepID=UPI00388D8309
MSPPGESKTTDDATAPIGVGSAHLAAAARLEPAGTVDDPSRPAALVARVKAALAWWQRTRAARADARFGSAGGGVLTGGIAYSALFSVFAGLTIGFTVFMAFLGNRTALRQDVLNTLATSLPGLIDTGDANGLLNGLA